MHHEPLKILVVDDSALYRQSIKNVLHEFPEIDVVGVAEDGLDALNKIEQLSQDLLTLDVQMPDMDGIELLREIKRKKLSTKAIMVSSLTAQGADVTTHALMEGAFDFVLKPSSTNSGDNRQQLRDQLLGKITAFRESQVRRNQVRIDRSTKRTEESREPPPVDKACKAVIIGTSTGGPVALKLVLSRISADCSVPLIVAQHMPAGYTSSLAARLNEICPLNVVEAENDTVVEAGKVIVAQGGKQLDLIDKSGRLTVKVSDAPPENGVRPSVDYLLRSAIDACDGNLLAVIMTGMGRDGLAGCRQLKEVGGSVFAQHQDDCTVYGMPKAVVDHQLADRILPLGKIAPAISRHIRRSRRASEKG